MRTSAYLHQKSQTQSVTLDPEFTETTESKYRIPHNVFIILGCLLTPIKRSINSVVLKHSTDNICFNNLVELMMHEIRVDQSDLLAKVEVQHFCGRYPAALKALGTMFEVSVEDMGFSHFAEIVQTYCESRYAAQTGSSTLSVTGCSRTPTISQEPISNQSYILELCSYLLYYTGNYKPAVDYFNWLVSKR